MSISQKNATFHEKVFENSILEWHLCSSESNEPKTQLIRDTYRQVPNIRRTLVGNKIVDHSDVVGASPVGAAPTASSFST